jgi:two-component system cell cycle response regulator DivK
MSDAKPRHSSGKRILIVEDNALNMKLLHDLLEVHGYDVVTAERGSEAIELARGARPDLILMDLQLPDISGFEATRQIKADPDTRAIPIIAVTAFAMAGDERRALECGCDAYVAKPVVLRELLGLVGSFLGGGIRPISG